MNHYFEIIQIINLLPVGQPKIQCGPQLYVLFLLLPSSAHISPFFQWILQQPGACVYMGCVGQDKYHQLLHDTATKAGLTLSYQVHVDPEGKIKTGACAVLITGNNR